MLRETQAKRQYPTRRRPSPNTPQSPWPPQLLEHIDRHLASVEGKVDQAKVESEAPMPAIIKLKDFVADSLHKTHTNT